jgi:hypothetical protein
VAATNESFELTQTLKILEDGWAKLRGVPSDSPNRSVLTPEAFGEMRQTLVEAPNCHAPGCPESGRGLRRATLLNTQMAMRPQKSKAQKAE